MAEPNADYVTICEAVPQRLPPLYVVSVMRWDHRDDGYIMRETAGPMTHHAAVHLADQWAKEKRLEVR